MRMELEDEKQPVGAMTQSYQKSFNRSLRSFLPTLAPTLRIHKIASDNGWAAGLLAGSPSTGSTGMHFSTGS